MKKCPKCGTQLPDDAKFCGRCAINLPEPVEEEIPIQPTQPIPATPTYKPSIPLPRVKSKTLMIIGAIVVVVMVIVASAFFVLTKQETDGGGTTTSGNGTGDTGDGTTDTTAPTISNVQASSITSSSAKITWSTNEASTSQVEYGTTTSYGYSTALSTALTTIRSFTLIDLTASTTYHYRVKSKDAANNLATSGDYTFTTLSGGGGGDTTPPTISNVQSSSITSSGATITWSTNEASTSQVEYGTTTSYGYTTTLGTTMVTSHSQPLSGLSPLTTYHYRVKSKDAASNLATSADSTFTTASTGGTGDSDGDGYTDDEDYMPYQDAKIKIIIKSFKVIDFPDSDDVCEIYFPIEINNKSITRAPSNDTYWNASKGVLYTKNWEYTYNVPDNIQTHEIVIMMWDSDDVWYDWEDDQLDIDGHDSSRGLTIYYNIQTGEWTGDDTDGITNGEDDDVWWVEDEYDAYLEYDLVTV